MNDPMRVAIDTGPSSITVSTDWRISKASGTYHLYEADNFAPAGEDAGMPENGDVFGLVCQLLHRAWREDSGINTIGVSGRKIFIDFSAACTHQFIRDLFMAALRACGVPYKIVRDTTSEVLPVVLPARYLG